MMSPVITTCPSRSPSPVTAVLAPSDVPTVTGIGRANSPVLTQTVPGRVGGDFGALVSRGGSLAGGSARTVGRTSGAISASADGVQRNAAFGTVSTLVSSLNTKRTLAVRYGSRVLSEFS